MTDGRAAALLALLTLAALGTLLPFRAAIERIWADEGTFLAMAGSLAYDRDLRFDERDRRRIETAGADQAGAGTIILERDVNGVISYSKPILYPLLAAPFVALFGDLGPALLNALVLAFALALAHALLRRGCRDPGGGRAALVLVTFAGASALLPYVLWRMGDVLQVALALAGLTLAGAGLRPPRTSDDPGGWRERILRLRFAPHTGAAFLGLLIAMRPTNAAVAAIPVLAYLFARRSRRALVLGLSTVAPYLLMLALTWLLTGHADPYRAPRTSFTLATGYPAGTGPEADAARARFDLQPASHHAPRLGEYGDRILYSAGYFVAGRHSGVLFYFPAALVLAAAALRRPDPLARAVLIAFAATAAFLVVWLPENYFGGHTFIGNRYLLAAYGALLLAPRRLPGRRLLALAWILAALGYASALVSEIRARGFAAYPSQQHAHAGLFRMLPYESTARDLMSRDRYWADSFVRFVDPFANVRRDDFVLKSDRPPTELLIARWQPAGTLRFEVETRAPVAWLEVRDYARRERHSVGANRRVDGVAVVDLRPSHPWRHHRFWFFPEKRYHAHVLRLALRVPEGERARARVRFLGDPTSTATPPALDAPVDVGSR